MRIVNRTEFLSLPSGTVYAKYESLGILGELCIKGDTVANDWWYQALVAVDREDSEEFMNIMTQAENSGVEIKLDFDCQGRDGLFEDQKFVVFNKKDVQDMTDLLRRSI